MERETPAVQFYGPSCNQSAYVTPTSPFSQQVKVSSKAIQTDEWPNFLTLQYNYKSTCHDNMDGKLSFRKANDYNATAPHACSASGDEKYLNDETTSEESLSEHDSLEDLDSILVGINPLKSSQGSLDAIDTKVIDQCMLTRSYGTIVDVAETHHLLSETQQPNLPCNLEKQAVSKVTATTEELSIKGSMNPRVRDSDTCSDSDVGQFNLYLSSKGLQLDLSSVQASDV